MNITEIAGAIGALRGTYDLVTAAIDLRDNSKLAELKATMLDQMQSVREKAFEISETNTALVREKRELEAEISRLRDHQQDIAENYERWTAGTGATVYRSKPVEGARRNTEYLCANCVADGVKTYLQPEGVGRTYKCSRGHGTTMF